MEAIFQRRSIRRYLNQPVEKEKILQVLKAAMAAPSSHNQQPWRFYVVTDKTKIKRLSEVSPYAAFAWMAPVIIVPAFSRDCQNPEMAPLDLSAAVENLWLEASSLGLGGVWMAIYPNKERMKKVRELIHIKQNEEAFALFSLGYPAQQKPPADRFREDWVTFIDK
jgi:nitroreductase